MQVQKIQSINNNYNTNFKASFVNDSHGYFTRLWQITKKNDVLDDQISKFATIYPEHQLEIIDTSDRALAGEFRNFTVFNHSTGKSRQFFSHDPEKLLTRFFDDIFCGFCKDLFDTDSKEAKMFLRLTGKKVKTAVKI